MTPTVGQMNAEIRERLQTMKDARPSASTYSIESHAEKHEMSYEDAVEYFEDLGYAVPGDDDWLDES